MNFEDKKPLPFEEQETVINIDYEEDIAYVYSSHRPTVKKQQSLVENNSDEVSVIFDDSYGMQIAIPKKWVSFKAPKKYSEEDKQKRSAQLAETRSKRRIS